MKFVLGFLIAFTFMAGFVVTIRVAMDDDPPPSLGGTTGADPVASGNGEVKDPHAGHNMPAVNEPDPPDNSGGGNGPDPGPALDLVDLNNSTCPVFDSEIEAGMAVFTDYIGYRVHLSSERAKRKFERYPVKYLMKLDLEVVEFDQATQKPSKLEQVDQSDYVTIAPEYCLMQMGNEIDVAQNVYVLHRGFKIHF